MGGLAGTEKVDKQAMYNGATRQMLKCNMTMRACMAPCVRKAHDKNDRSSWLPSFSSRDLLTTEAHKAPAASTLHAKQPPMKCSEVPTKSHASTCKGKTYA